MAGDDVVKLLLPLDEEPVDAVEEPDELEELEELEELGVGEGEAAFGEKLLFPVPNPTFAA